MSYINLIRGDSFSPLSDTRKCVIAESLITGGIGAVGSIISGNNAADKALQNQRALIREQNAYNTPLQQRRRLEAAGLNPYLLAGGIGSGNQAIAGDSSTAASLQGQGGMTAANMIGNVAMQMAQIRSLNAEAQGKEIDNVTKGEINQTNSDILKQQLKDWSFKVDHLNPSELSKLNEEIGLLINQKSTEISKADNLDALTKKISEEIKGVKLNNDQMTIVRDQLKERLELERRNLQMQNATGYINAAANQTSAQAAASNAMTNAFLSKSEDLVNRSTTNSIRWDNQWKSRTLSPRVALPWLDKEYYVGDKWTDRISKGVHSLAEGVGVYSTFKNGKSGRMGVSQRIRYKK